MSSSEYTLQLPDGSGPISIGLLDEAAAAKIQALLERTDAVEVRLMAGDADTSGHAMESGSVVVQATIGDDVEGHAFSLRFANAAAAVDFQKKLIATGAMAATLTAAAVGAGILAQSVPANPALDAEPGFAAVERQADWDVRHHPGAVSGIHQAPGIYYSASSAASGIRDDVQASVPQAPGIYYSASSAASGIQVGVDDGAITLNPVDPGVALPEVSIGADYRDAGLSTGAGVPVDEYRDAGLSTGAGAPSLIDQYPDRPLSPGSGAADDTLPDQTNLRGTDKSLPGV